MKYTILIFLLVVLGLELTPFTIVGDDEFVYTNFTGANLTLSGSAMVMLDGLLELTNSTSQFISGHAFHPTPLRFRESENDTLRSFSASFVFGIIPASPNIGGHGLALVVAPSKNLSTGVASEYLGLLNGGNNGDPRNHIFALELDTIESPDFYDMNNNHVGVDVNSLISVNASNACYYDDKTGVFHNLTLTSGKPMQVWVAYDGETTQIDVTLVPIGMNMTMKPLVSTKNDLSAVITDQAYIGFSSSTGTLSSSHYVLGWSFALDMPAPIIDITKLPKLPRKNTKPQTKVILAIILSILAVVFVLVIAIFLLLRRRWDKYGELRENWEIEFGAHRLSYKDLFHATEGFKNNNLLGVGGFGSVYKGVLPGSKLEVAVKRVSHGSKQGMKEFIAEVVSIGRARHRNLVQLLGYCRCKDELLLVYDYMPNGSLDNYLYGLDGKPILNWAQRFRIIKGVASGLLYLHEEWEQIIIHRDIKSSNVLLDDDMNGRLGDFGLAKLYNHGTELQSTIVVGTIGYLAPELTQTGQASPLSDVFAFGTFLLEVICGRRPIVQNTEGEKLLLVDWVSKHWRNQSLTKIVDTRLKGNYDIDEVRLTIKLGLMCSHSLPNARPNIRQVIQYLNGDVSLTELTPTQLNLNIAFMPNEGFDSYVMSSPSSRVSVGTMSDLSNGR